MNHHVLPAAGRTVIDRAMAFRAELARWFRGRRRFDVVHFRSVWEGYPLALHKHALCGRLVFEVNGLPSIELKYHYPAVAQDEELLRKLAAQEQACLDAADLIVTPSRVTADYLVARGTDANRVRVIPNGVDLDLFPYAPPRQVSDDEIRLLYSGTQAAWQGVHRAIEALALLRRDRPASLTLVGPATRRQQRDVLRLCDEFDVTPHVTVLNPLPQSDLARLYPAHDVALAPLPANDRNVVQGCCPLKVLEAMAAGTPLVAGDLPVVRDLVEAEVHALLVRPGSAKAIKDAVLRLATEPGLGERLSATARERVEAEYTWQHAGAALVDAYHSLLDVPADAPRICG